MPSVYSRSTYRSHGSRGSGRGSILIESPFCAPEMDFLEDLPSRQGKASRGGDVHGTFDASTISTAQHTVDHTIESQASAPRYFGASGDTLVATSRVSIMDQPTSEPGTQSHKDEKKDSKVRQRMLSVFEVLTVLH
jgi:hypothetical protein